VSFLRDTMSGNGSDVF